MRTWLHRLRAWFSRSRLRLGKPIRLHGDVVISFRGKGLARFRVQHTKDFHGKPYEFGWCDVSAMCNGLVPREATVDLTTCRVNGMLAERIIGDHDAHYRHFSAAWLRVIPFDDDAKTRKECERYVLGVRAA